jgi:TatD DNase family protein
VTIDLIDIGINLMHRSFGEDRAGVMARGAAVGVRRLIITGSSERSSAEAAQFAKQHPGKLYATAGVHPHDSQHCTDRTIPALRALALQPQVVAIGECGLDYNRDFSPRPLQDKWFAAQIELACEIKKPLFLHERDAHQRFVEIISEYKDRLPKAVVHCFTGTAAELKTYLDLGFYIGITGWICDERRGYHLRELVRTIPLDRLMIETDAPFLTPRDLRPQPKHNEPMYLPHVLSAIAKAIGKPDQAVGAAVTQTTLDFFAIGAK